MRISDWSSDVCSSDLSKDVAEVGLGSENFSISTEFDGLPASGMALRLATGGNLLDAVENVREVISGLEPYLPEGVKVVYPYDTSPMVETSINSVVHTQIGRASCRERVGQYV